MEFAQFDKIERADLEELFRSYYPRKEGLTPQEKTVYLASEYVRIRRVEIPELEDGGFLDAYLREDKQLLQECSTMLGVDCAGKLTRLECAYICAAYWSSELDFELSEKTRVFLEKELVNTEESTTHLEWIVFRHLEDPVSSLARERLRARDFTFECELEYSSSPPAAQIREKLRVLSLLHRYWSRSPSLESLKLGGTQPEVTLKKTKLRLVPLLKYYEENPRRRPALRDEMKSFISSLNGTNISGIRVTLEEMKVDLLGRIWVEDVRSITVEFAPDYYRVMVAGGWNSTLVRRGYESLDLV